MRYPGAPGTFHLAAGREVRNFTVGAPPEILAGYLEDEVPPVLANMVDPTEETKAFTPLPVSQEMRRTVSEMIQPGLTGQLRKVQLESAALMYITLVARALEQEPPPGRTVSATERDAAEAIHARLSRSLQDPPTLSELAI
ncbi:MAG: hypothetical protein VW405_14605 [Rhodospirillaceae bacterium]